MPQELIPKIIRSKRRTLTLEIRPDASLVIRAPMRVSMQVISDIMEKKRSWIIEKQQKAKDRYQPVPKREFVEGEEFLYLGNSYKLRAVDNWNRPFELSGTEFLIGQQFLGSAKRMFEDWYIKQAQELLSERVQIYAAMAGQDYSRITITSARTRWGSCSFKRTLNFSWRLIMAPLEMIDYVVAHEVAHLQELNHSARFWKKVESLVPDYKMKERWFKDNQHLLRF